MAPTRKLTGGLYSHGGITVAYLATEQWYAIREVGAAMRRAAALSNERNGQVTLRLHENEEHPETQCFILLPKGKRIRRGQFEEMIRTVFPGYTLDTKWITDVLDPRLIIALLGRRLFDRD